MSKYAKKRKHDLDSDTTGGNESSPEKSGKRSRRREASGSPERDDGGGNVESMSVEETNALRASLGLAPLVVEEAAPTMRESESGGAAEKVVTQDGIEFVHKAAVSVTQAKLSEKLKEKLETHAAKRKVQSKVLKSKGLADSSDEEEGGVESWIEAQRRKAEEKANEYDQLDGEIEQAAVKRPKRPPTAGKRPQRPSEYDALAGMTVGHSKTSFMTGQETILVLDDKNVLDDDGEEVLVNPTLMYNEQLQKNKELREKKPGYNPYDDEMVDEFGQVQKKNVLAKYDEGVDGPVGRETFKLNSRGTLDIAKEEEELRVKRKLHMANKQLQSLETPKYKVASEFYTEEEMISFRKPKKKKDKSTRKVRGSKSSALKADDLMPLEPEAETTEEKEAREAKLRARRRAVDKEAKEEDFKPIPEAIDAEDGEIIEPPKPEKTRFRNTMGATVDTSRLRSLASKLAAESESDDDDFGPADNLAGVVIDDEVEDELTSALDRARKERLAAQAAAVTDGATAVTELLSKIKKEEPADEDMDVDEGKGVVFDSTAEYYKTIGSRPTYGLAGNREDEVDFSELHAEEARELAKKERRRKEREADAAEEERRRVKKEKKHLLAASSKKEKETSSKDDRDRHHRDRKRRHHEEEEDEDVDMEAVAEESGSKKGEHENVLGKERDVTKGVAAMLKLAGEKGYLDDPNAKKNRGGTLKHLESKNIAKVEFMKPDIDDKYLKKMERVGTTGSGPIRPFVDKHDYTPQIEIVYTDTQGREMEPKAAFRDMSHKFHGKGSSKNQIEKRMRQQEKKEKMKKMNSFDTPLGTLSKQVKKQEQTGSHYIILSGNSRDTGAPLQKE